MQVEDQTVDEFEEWSINGSTNDYDDDHDDASSIDYPDEPTDDEQNGSNSENGEEVDVVTFEEDINVGGGGGGADNDDRDDGNDDDDVNVDAINTDVVVIGHLEPCCVCYQSYPMHRFGLADLPMLPVNGMVYVNPCKQHYICYQCVRQSLLTSAFSILQTGGGHFPCLSGTDCKNHLHQTTTTYLYQLQDFFSSQEWQSIMQVNSNVIKSQRQDDLISFHPYLGFNQCNRTEQPRNVERQASLIIYITSILSQHQESFVHCAICSVTLQKTTACNAIRHCDWEVCWCCGKIERRLSGDHWNTCPRYDTDSLWAKHGFLCKEDVCYNETNVCVQPQHQSGKRKQNQIMMAFKLGRVLESLEKNVINAVIDYFKSNHDFIFLAKMYQQYLKNYNACKI